jgi:type III secretion protein K
MSMISAATPAAPAAPGAMDLLRLVARYNLHPELDLHPSWLPGDWPARHRKVERFGVAGQAVLSELLRREIVAEPQFNFDSRLRRLALLDVPSLRRVAIYTGLCAHKPMFKLRGGVGAQLRRQAQRIAPDAADFVAERMPQLTEIRMNPQRLQERPLSAGRVVLSRGYRLLIAALFPEGQALTQRVQRKLPRRVAALNLPSLNPRQSAQLQELMLLCIVPERLPEWDWLF